jgi:deoxyguanosine kinase
MRYKHIAIEGAIGAGKTTLATHLARELKATLMLEKFKENPFIQDFYSEPQRYALQLELWFLTERLKQMAEYRPVQGYFVADYFAEKCLVFARNTLDAQEFQLFSDLYRNLCIDMPAPDILIYLWLPVDKLIMHIKKRGRPYELNIKPGYLEKIQENYLLHLEKSKNQRILLIDPGTVDITGDPEGFDALLRIIDQDYTFGITRKEL